MPENINMEDKNSPTTITQLVHASRGSNTASSSERKAERNAYPETKIAPEKAGIAPDVADNDSVKRKVSRVNILEKLLKENMLVPGSKIGQDIRDDYRRIKRPLVSNACGRNRDMVERGNIILVSSSIPGEGKTYTSINLALSMSQEIDNTVLLVDCDTIRQGATRMLGLKTNQAGLVDVLQSDDLDISDVLLQTDMPNFRILAAGSQHEYANELLASNRMYALVDELASRYKDRIVIFDGPPLLASPQARVLAGLVGQVVFVIEAGKTPQALVEEAVSMIPEEQATGLILNKNEGLPSATGYYYGYYGPTDGES